MKRSEALIEIKNYLSSISCQEISPEEVLGIVEKLGMLPPSVPAKLIRGSDYSFGSGCSMRCDCDECNPNFGMTVWEKE